MKKLPLKTALTAGWILCFSYSLFSLSNTLAFITEAEIAQGIIVRVNITSSRLSSNNSRFDKKDTINTVIKHKPLIKFKTQTGKVIEFISEINCSDCKAGQNVEVFYPVNKPSKAEIKTINLWGDTFGYAALGFFLLLLRGIQAVLFWFINFCHKEAEEADKPRKK